VARRIITWDEFKSDVDHLSWELRKTNRKWTKLVAITRGGLVPAAVLSHKMGFRTIDTVCLEVYEGEEAKNEVIHKTLVDESGNVGKGWLVVDDLTDGGDTAQVVKAMLPGAYLAVVYAKPKGMPSVDCYAVETDQDTWLVFPWEKQKE
jgi:xanthine phosphoribosyltransferase